MQEFEKIKRPTKEEQQVAFESYNVLTASLEELRSEAPEIEIEETEQKIRVPLSALRLLASILKATSQGKLISIVPIETEITTQSAAEALGCSRPHLVKLLENGTIPFTKIGRHRRIRFDDIMAYKKKMKAEQKNLLIEMMKDDEQDKIYDS